MVKIAEIEEVHFRGGGGNLLYVDDKEATCECEGERDFLVYSDLIHSYIKGIY